MKTTKLPVLWAGFTMIVVALSLGPSWAHVLEAPPRLFNWSPELWRQTTVFNGQFSMFAAIGAPVDLLAILCPALLAWLVRNEPQTLRFAVAAALFQALSLGAWFALVAPANAVLATWTPGPIANDFDDVRLRWEIGHMIVAALKLVGVSCLTACLLSIGRRSAGS